MLLKSRKLTFILILLTIIMLIIFPDICHNGAIKGIMLCSNVVIPSLFPFMVCVLMLIKMNLKINNKLLNKIIYIFFGQNTEMFFVFILSMVGGYPVGARLINELYKQNKIDNKTANIMLMYCVNAGPAFIISVVGSSLRSKTLGTVLLFSHLLSSIIIAIFCRKFIKILNVKLTSSLQEENMFSSLLTQSVADASTAILNICSFIIIFSSLNEYLNFFLKDNHLKYVPYLLEVTSAVTQNKNVFFISFLLGFSGVSVWCQVIALSRGRKINLVQFIFGRLLHGVLSFAITKIIIFVFKINISVYSNNINFKNEIIINDLQLYTSIFIMIIVLFIFVFSKNNSGKLINDVI